MPRRPPVLALPRGCAKQCAGAGRSAGGVRRCSGGDGGAALPEVWGAVGRSEEDRLPRCEVTRRSERACGRHARHARVVAARAGAPAPALSRGRSLDGRKGGECVQRLWEVADEVATFVRERESCLPTRLPARSSRSGRLTSGSSPDRPDVTVPGRQRVGSRLSRVTGRALGPLEGPVVRDATGCAPGALSYVLSCVRLAESVRSRLQAQGRGAAGLRRRPWGRGAAGLRRRPWGMSVHNCFLSFAPPQST